MKVMNKVNLILGFTISVCTSVFGVYWYLFAGFLLFNIIDWLTGWYYAYLIGAESSKVGSKGIIKKIGYWIVIFISFYISKCFTVVGDMLEMDLSLTIGLGWFVLASYLVNEIRSILENGVKLDWNIPELLIKGLEITADKIKK